MTISSSSFYEGDEIPTKYTCLGENSSPAITNSDIPQNTKSLVLIMDDPDAPSGLFTHWMIYNMSPTTLQLLENQKPMMGTYGMNDFGSIEYKGPCPPPGTGIHRYYFRLYALDKILSLPAGVKRSVLISAMESHIIATAELMGRCGRETS